uniref:Uncharacterized protein n=1 Tax=Anguilla anguilla TaxID=7936 RepID=A0A0E9QAM9_ANGAN
MNSLLVLLVRLHI